MTTERADRIEAELRAAGGQPVQVVSAGQTLVLFIGEPQEGPDPSRSALKTRVRRAVPAAAPVAPPSRSDGPE